MSTAHIEPSTLRVPYPYQLPHDPACGQIKTNTEKTNIKKNMLLATSVEFVYLLPQFNLLNKFFFITVLPTPAPLRYSL